MAKKKVIEDQISNDAHGFISFSEPYIVQVIIRGCADYLYHKYNCDAVEQKSNSPKNSKSKKTDDLESFVYRNEEGFLSIPGEQLRMAIIMASKFKQDPRSPRKSAMDLHKAGIVTLTSLASTGKKNWDYEDKRRVVIQKSSIQRIRPALNKNWEASFYIQVLLPEYIGENDLLDTLNMAGKLCGLGDFRPTYGRFQIIEFKKIL